MWALVDDNQKRFINELSDQSESSLLDFGTVNSLLFCWNNNSFKITFLLSSKSSFEVSIH
ncbi:hypothetical protein B9J90_06690 [Vibrio sp. V09_P4A23P171]|uniref:Uncharacterized protein n=1 Tax=Vibrio anguillarum TaxID=55601 RepID=A0A191W153_VIBAN|nr:hypothetical protein VAA_03978 [Vibrio anguillarum 775]AGU58702.1 hypothetical protein N175_00345 [Vibrio anguillarum M3]AQM18275.1 hypothetical protein PN51_00300 [Vibrio anguillarum]MDQ2192793.1 hypothetical protein [Vibrio sp. A14(2019)]MDQ2198539.1 hypothetical protein [Vibrio sp. 2017_1457_11]NAW91299.1 hypothetical protein [Vibrio sp. V24_P1S3T111]NAW98206.1 hypothetical protein [Vibrio sp. V23_P3S9T160]NAX44691.1 hypothetical protein [Vibrio sp. V25_P4S6T154]NNN48369.1 hypothetica